MVLSSGCATAPVRSHAPVSLTYLGVAGWQISDGTHTVLVDPYFSRPADPWKDLPDLAAIRKRVPQHADVVLVGHAHPDHALDAPEVAKLTGAALVGSPEVLEAAHKAGLPDESLLVAKGGEDYQFDGYSVRVIPALHSAIGYPYGDVDTVAFLVRIGGAEILIFDTANFIERELAGLHPDAAIVAPGARQKIHDYSCRLMRALGEPKTVLTTHFDAWKKPAETPLDADALADLRAFESEIRGCSPGTTVIVPKPFTPLALP